MHRRRDIAVGLATHSVRSLDAWSELFDEDIEISVDAGSMRGVPAARAYAANVVRANPGVLAELERVVAESDDTIVVEYRLVNPAGDRSQDAWRLDGLVRLTATDASGGRHAVAAVPLASTARVRRASGARAAARSPAPRRSLPA